MCVFSLVFTVWFKKHSIFELQKCIFIDMLYFCVLFVLVPIFKLQYFGICEPLLTFWLKRSSRKTLASGAGCFYCCIYRNKCNGWKTCLIVQNCAYTSILPYCFFFSIKSSNIETHRWKENKIILNCIELRTNVPSSYFKLFNSYRDCMAYHYQAH